jgi:hypothetical protein
MSAFGGKADISDGRSETVYLPEKWNLRSLVLVGPNFEEGIKGLRHPKRGCGGPDLPLPTPSLKQPLGPPTGRSPLGEIKTNSNPKHDGGWNVLAHP